MNETRGPKDTPEADAGGALAPLKAAAEARGASDFTNLWAGQAASLCYETGSGDLTRRLAEDAAKRLQELALGKQGR